jgi:hypothetical protein
MRLTELLRYADADRLPKLRFLRFLQLADKGQFRLSSPIVGESLHCKGNRVRQTEIGRC